MRKWIVAAVCCALGSAHAAPVGTTIVLERSVVRVNGAVIWASDVEARTRGADPKDQPGVLDAMIDEELIVAEGHKVPVTVDQSEVMAALEEIKTSNNLDDAAFDAVLKESGYTRARYLIDLERQLLILRTSNQFIQPRVFVGDADVAAEAKVRKLPNPSADDKLRIQADLRKKAVETETMKWLAELRKRASIERRP